MGKQIKINEVTLKEMVKESVKKMISEAMLGDTEPDENGCKLMSGDQVFNEIDNQLARFGDAHISRFYSDDSNVVVAVHRDIYFKCRDEIKGIMSEYSYRFYDVGSDGDYAMMTFKSEPGLALGESKEQKENVVKLDENTLKQIVTESVKNVLKENMLNDYYSLQNVVNKVKQIVYGLVDTFGNYEPITSTYGVGIIREMKNFLINLSRQLQENPERTFNNLKSYGVRTRNDILKNKDLIKPEEAKEIRKLYDGLVQIYQIVKDYWIKVNRLKNNNAGRLEQ